MNNAKNTTLFPYLERLLEGEAVEWKTLGEVAEIGTGSSNRQDESENGLYPFYVRSKNILRSSTYQFDEIAIIIPGEGGIGDIFHYAEGKYALHQRAYRIKVNTENELFPKFLFYYMTKAFKPFILARCVGATATSIRKPMLADFPIPVPPLRIQARIVEILDKFTQLEAELEAELEARRKQYAYYRDQLLNFSQYPPLNVNIEWKALGEIAELYSGLSGKTKEHFQKGNAPYVTYKNIFDNLAVDSSILEMVSIGADERQHAVKYGDVLITGSSENIEEVGMSSVVTFHPEKEIYLNSFSFGIRFHSAVQLSPEFTKYLFRSELLRKQIMKTASGVTRFNVSKKKFSEITLPIPPLSEQRRIVDILDRFDTLTNSISEGLPKEIALRRKQYAYYRDALLSFPRPEVSA